MGAEPGPPTPPGRGTTVFRAADERLAKWGAPIERSGIALWADILSRLSIFAAVTAYFASCGDREAARHYQAWQVVTAANSQTVSGGRIQALEDLADDKVSLAGIDLRDAWLPGVRLPAAQLQQARLDSAVLTKANLELANLASAHLVGAALDSACLRGAYLRKADLRGIDLAFAGMQGAVLWDADLSSLLDSRERTHLQYADLEGADLRLAQLDGADMRGANLRGALLGGAVLTDVRLDQADLEGADFTGALLQGTRFRGAKNWRKIRSLDRALMISLYDTPGGFLGWADRMGATRWSDSAKNLTPFGQRRRFIRQSQRPPVVRTQGYGFERCQLGSIPR